MIKISIRDVLADLPPSVLKKRIQEIELRDRENRDVVFTDVDSLYDKISIGWSLIFNEEGIGGSDSMASPEKITRVEKDYRETNNKGIRVTTMRGYGINFYQKYLFCYHFYFDNNNKIIKVKVKE